MTRSVALNQNNVSLIIRLVDDLTGKPAESVVAATAGHAIWYRRENAVVVTDVTSAADLALLTTTHTDWNFLHIRDGYYRVDYPDAAFVEGVGGVLCGMDATDISCVAEYVEIDPLKKFNGVTTGPTAITTTFPAAANVEPGDTIAVIEGTGEQQTRLVTSVASDVATHKAWGVNITASTVVLLIAGDEARADSALNHANLTDLLNDVEIATVSNAQSTPSATLFDVNDTITGDQESLLGKRFKFLTGALTGELGVVTGTAAATGVYRLTVERGDGGGFSAAPANADTLLIGG